jgi:hypothetical protein
MYISKKRNTMVIRAEDADARNAALRVLSVTYRDEKQWTPDEATLFPEEDLANDNISWFVVFADDLPVGVLRVHYEPPLHLYEKYGFEMTENSLDVGAFIRENKIAEIGRFAVLPAYRDQIIVVGMLMRASTRDTIIRGYSHYITDIFENEEHNPYLFHTRVMGFQPVATHNVGELSCLNRRITMLLNIKQAYKRLKKNGSWIYRFLTEEWDAKLHEQVSLD